MKAISLWVDPYEYSVCILLILDATSAYIDVLTFYFSNDTLLSSEVLYDRENSRQGEVLSGLEPYHHSRKPVNYSPIMCILFQSTYKCVYNKL